MSEETDKQISPRLAKLKQQQEKIRKQITLEKKKQRTNSYKIDTRRKIVDGALIQNYAYENPDFLSILNKLRNEKITSNKDREIFNLPALDKTAEEK
ncbi:MAG: hypothetical protein KAJ63_00595 [Methyloprofundus sp.]|nr:hypothetical protein [Methyloprofundus sp.]